MTLSIRVLLMLLATILFIVAALNNDNASDLIAIGLACFAGAFVIDETGVGARLMGGSRRV